MNEMHVQKVNYGVKTHLLTKAFPSHQQVTTSLREAFVMAMLTTYYERTLAVSVETERHIEPAIGAEVLSRTKFFHDGQLLGKDDTVAFHDPHLNHHFLVIVHAPGEANIVIYHTSDYDDKKDFSLRVMPDIGMVRMLCGLHELPLREGNNSHLIQAARMLKLALGNDQESINIYNMHPLDLDLKSLGQ